MCGTTSKGTNMKNLIVLIAIAVLAVHLSCGNGNGTTEPEELPTLTGSYEGIYYYSQYVSGAQNKIISQHVRVSFDGSQFRMIKSDGPREVCDINAPYTSGAKVTINCPELPYDCPEYENACGDFSATWKGDSLKLTCSYTDEHLYSHLKRLELKKKE